MAYRRLGEILVEEGALSPQQLEQGLEWQKGTGQRLGTVLLSHGLITEAQLLRALKVQLGLDFVDLTRLVLPAEAAQLLPKEIARRFQVVPLCLHQETLCLAMADPLDFYALEEVRRATHHKILPFLAAPAAVEHAVMELYGNEGTAKAIAELEQENGKEFDLSLKDTFTANALEGDADAAPAVRLVNSILERAISECASDIHLEPMETELRVRIRIDGILQQVLTLPKELQSTVISRFKIMAGMDIAEHRLPQDGRCSVQMQEKNIDLRISVLPTACGEKLAARLLDLSGFHICKENLGLTAQDLGKYNRMIHAHTGLVLLVGPTGSGKSTTMYTMVTELNTSEVNIVTLEDPVEYHIGGVNQVQVSEKTGLTFAHGLRAVLRQDPDIIGVGEIRDAETARIALRAASTGHLVLSTVHTNDAVGTLERLVDMGIEPYRIAEALRGVISQRLVRRICPYCRTAYTPDENELRTFGMQPQQGLTFYRGSGCPHCFHTGYRGRIAVFELFWVTHGVRTLIARHAGRDAIEQELQNQGGFVSMRQNALELVREGITTAEEIRRVIYEAE